MSILLDIHHRVGRYTPHHRTRDEVLDAMADDHLAEKKETLDWRNSVVDRMKLLRIDEKSTGFEPRKRMAAYYGIFDYKGTEGQNRMLADAITDDLIGG